MGDMINIQVFPVGHKLYSEGRVFVQHLNSDGTVATTEQHTLEEWADLQQQAQ